MTTYEGLEQQWSGQQSQQSHCGGPRSRREMKMYESGELVSGAKSALTNVCLQRVLRELSPSFPRYLLIPWEEQLVFRNQHNVTRSKEGSERLGSSIQFPMLTRRSTKISPAPFDLSSATSHYPFCKKEHWLVSTLWFETRSFRRTYVSFYCWSVFAAWIRW